MVPQLKKCQNCKRLFSDLPFDGIFCSTACQIRYRQKHQNVPATNDPSASEMGIDNENTDDETDVSGEVWRDAGIRFEALTKKSIAREQIGGGPQSVIVAGHGASLKVHNGALVVRHGMTYSPQEVISEEFYRAVFVPKRIVWCSERGTLSCAALNWCSQQEVGIVVLNRDGKVIFESTPYKSVDMRVKRAQYNISQEREFDVARWLILGKVLGQQETYKRFFELRNHETDVAFRVVLPWLSADSVSLKDRNARTFRLYEARAASAYFNALSTIPLHWATSDRNKIPEHWKTFGQRASPLPSRNIGAKAVLPAQAILNYAYGILEHVSRVALLAVGLDTGVGILHADMLGRESLIYDLMELGRGAVDAMVVYLLKKTDFHKGDFIQTVKGED